MRYTFGGSRADWVLAVGDQVVDDADLVVGYVAEMRTGVVITFWDAASGGTQYTDLVDVDGTTPIGSSVTSDAVGSIPRFKGPDGVRVVWGSASSDGTATRYAMTPIDLGAEVGAIDTRVAVLEAGGIGSAVPETIRFAAATVTAAQAADPPAAYRAYNDTGASQTVTAVRASCSVPPSSGPIVFDVLVDGISVFTLPADRPSIAAAATTSGVVTPTGSATVPTGSHITVVPTAGDDTAEAITVEVRVV